MTTYYFLTLFSLILIFDLNKFCLTTKNITLRIEPSKRQAFGVIGQATCGGPLPNGCPMPVAALPPAPVVSAPPMPTGRLIPQALPGAPCEPGVECTGGSVCSQGICLCPPELVQEGTVCVSRTIYGVMPPPPVVAAAAPPPPIPVAYYPSPLPPPMPAPIAPAPMPLIPSAVVASYPIAPSPSNPCIPPYGRFRAACVRKDGEQIQNEGFLYNLDDDVGSNSIEREVEWKK